MNGWRHWVPPAGSIPTLRVPSLEGIGRVHLVGIGGAGMRNLARLLAARGIAVSGSDLKDSVYLRELDRLGVQVRVGHDPAAVEGAEAVIISSAIGEHNPEFAAAVEQAIPVWRRQQALAALATGRRAIAVTGTHGKTTTTSMLATVLERAGADPTYLVGGDLNESGSGARHGEGDVFIFEADESDGSHLLMRPWVGVLTTVDVDHTDLYRGGLEEIVRSFAEFADRAEHVVACGDDPGVVRALQVSGRTDVVTYGLETSNAFAVHVDDLGPEGARGTLSVDGAEVPLSLAIDGPHNLANAAAAIAAAGFAGVDPAVAADALRGFAGVHRRFEFRGAARGAEFYDDYGHTPTEMAVTVETARRRQPRRLIALVQPHRYGRVQAGWRELGASVAGADLVIVTDVYGAQQVPIPGVTGKLVVDGVQLAAPGRRTVYLPHRRDVVSFLQHELREGDLVVTMGCGDVWMLADAALERMRDGGS